MPRPRSRGPASRPGGDFDVYLVTDRAATRGRALVETVAAALDGGVRAVQLREKDLPTRALFDLALRLRAATEKAAARLLVNDRIDVALACGADGVHLPSGSFRVRDARRLLGRDRIIGVSTHDPAEVAAASSAGADFVVFGPIFHTPSKAPYGPPLGLAALERAASAAPIPVLAIGGVDLDAVGPVLAAGASGVAVIRSILAADDPAGAARRLCAAFRAPAP